MAQLPNEIVIRIDPSDLERLEKAFAKVDKTSLEAIQIVVSFALESLPPLAIIGACDRVLWWLDQQKTKGLGE